MYLPIPIGYFVAVFLFISGVMSCMEFLENQQEISSRAELLNELACKGWGIIAASVILLLIQINRQLESLRFSAHTSAEPAPARIKKQKPEPTEQAPAANQQPKPRQVYPNSPIPGGGRVPQKPDTATGKDEAGKLSYFKVD